MTFQLRRTAWFRGAFFYLKEIDDVAKVSPGEFIRQVRTEAGRVHWPTRKETVATAIMVMIMAIILAIFFFGVDAVFSTVVKALLKLIG